MGSEKNHFRQSQRVRIGRSHNVTAVANQHNGTTMTRTLTRDSGLGSPLRFWALEVSWHFVHHHHHHHHHHQNRMHLHLRRHHQHITHILTHTHNRQGAKQPSRQIPESSSCSGLGDVAISRIAAKIHTTILFFLSSALVLFSNDECSGLDLNCSKNPRAAVDNTPRTPDPEYEGEDLRPFLP